MAGLDLKLTGSTFRTSLSPLPLLRQRMQVPEIGGFEALSHTVGKVWCARSSASRGLVVMPPKELQEVFRKQFYAEPPQWWDNRRSKTSPLHPDFIHKSRVALWLNNRHGPACVDSQLTRLDVGMKTTPDWRFNSCQVHEASAAHEGHLELGICRKLCEDGRISDAVDALELLVQRGCHLPNYLFYRVLKRCIKDKDLVLGRRIHGLTVKSGYEGDAFLTTHLICLYASHGRLEEAMQVFTRVSAPDAYNWATIIFAYARHGKAAVATEAIRLYRQMCESTNVKPDDRIYSAVLKACASAGDLIAGKEVHAHILASPGTPSRFVQAGLVTMYAKCGSLEYARRLFDKLPDKDVVTWNAMIAGYVQQGMGHEALSFYSSMQKEGLTPNSVTYVCVLQACASVGVRGLDEGKHLHAQIEHRELQEDVVLGGSLVNMYAKCGGLEVARSVFDRLPEKNVVAWTAMLAGYAQQGMGHEALSLYSSMQQEGVTPPNYVTYVCLLQACAAVAALPVGEQLHAQIEERGVQADGILGAALVNMYAKCGSMYDAQRVFDSLPERSVEAWGALVSGYARQGDSQVVFDLLDRMRLECMQPNEVVFLSVLTVCSHLGLVDKGREYFKAMGTDYRIKATVEHYICMVDLLGRSGHLDEALQMAKAMPFPPNDAVWHTLLGACRKWKNVKVGQQALMGALSVDEKDAVSYVLMSNIYASAQMWEAAKEMQARRTKLGAWKKPGQSWWTDMSGVVHTFLAGDKEHPESGGIYARLAQLVPKMKKEGYVPHLQSSLLDMSDYEKEAELCGHSEKLAIAYALNKTSQGTTIRIVKNLRVCEDCHTATCYISKVERRTIICRDASRFHVFKEGRCSCGDYW